MTDSLIVFPRDSSPTPAELSASEIFNETVLDQLPLGVVVVDSAGYVVKYNRFEEDLARRDRADVIGRSFFHDVAVCTDVPQVRGLFDEHIDTNTLAADVEFAFALPFLPRPRDVRLRLQSFELGGAHFGVVLIEDITVRKELERERERLIHILVHDLNNPLQGILGYASMLGDGFLGQLERDEQRRAIHSIDESARRMKRLIDGTLSEIEGEKRLKRPVNLHALVLSAVGNQLPTARANDIVLRYGGRPFERTEFPDRAVVILGWVDQLASLVQNLLSNAVKYAESEVSIELREELGAAVLEVRDDGPGIARDEQRKIFAEGYQVAGSRSGHGIGLFSVRRVVDTHGGEIELESELGEGTLFRVRLPAP